MKDKGGQQSMQLHNRKQIEHYSSKIRPRMVPKATPYIFRLMDELIKFANIEVTDNVLEVGCGMGRFTLPLAGRGIHVEGLDLNQFLLNKLEEYNKSRHNIPLHCADIVNYSPELNNRFDVVIGFFTLQPRPIAPLLIRCFSGYPNSTLSPCNRNLDG